MNKKCKPNRVKDGDTLEVYVPSEHHIEVRLVGIDAPETTQSWGVRSAEILRKLVYGRQSEMLDLVVLGTDSYGRAIAELWDGDLFINAELVRQGLAWYSDKSAASSRNASLIEAAETEAKENGLGMWSTSNPPIPPWKFRS